MDVPRANAFASDAQEPGLDPLWMADPAFVQSDPTPSESKHHRKVMNKSKKAAWEAEMDMLDLVDPRPPPPPAVAAWVPAADLERTFLACQARVEELARTRQMDPSTLILAQMDLATSWLAKNGVQRTCREGFPFGDSLFTAFQDLITIDAHMLRSATITHARLEPDFMIPTGVYFCD